MSERIRDANKKYEDAARHLAAVVAEEYPIGSEHRFADGRGSWLGRIVGEPSWWANPIHVNAENLRTGKSHSVSVLSIVQPPPQMESA